MRLLSAPIHYTVIFIISWYIKCSSPRKIPKHNANHVFPRCNKISNYHSNHNATLRINHFETLSAVDKFCYLGDMISVESDAIHASSVRIVAFWRKWLQIAALLMNKDIDLIIRCLIYGVCPCLKPARRPSHWPALLRVLIWKLCVGLPESLTKTELPAKQ